MPSYKESWGSQNRSKRGASEDDSAPVSVLPRDEGLSARISPDFSCATLVYLIAGNFYEPQVIVLSLPEKPGSQHSVKDEEEHHGESLYQPREGPGSSPEHPTSDLN